MTTNFDFLTPEWPEVHESAAKAEEFVHRDARASCIYARRTLELLVPLAELDALHASL